MKIKKNIFELIDKLIEEEKKYGIKFNKQGLPIFEDWMFYKELPDEILPYNHRKSCVDSNKTIICFYEHDKFLYRRLEQLDNTATELNKYAGFVGFDLSIFSDFLKPFQDFYVLANLVIDVYFILKGNKLIPNLRSDETGGDYFELFKDAPIVCCGTLGCSKAKKTKYKNIELIEQYANSHSNQILIQYGPNLVTTSNTRSYKSFGWRNKNVQE